MSNQHTYFVEYQPDAVYLSLLSPSRSQSRTRPRDSVWEVHSWHSSYSEAIDQSDMIGGRVSIGYIDEWDEANIGITDKSAYEYATKECGFDGGFGRWRTQDDAERDAWEQGASGIPTS